MNIGELWNCQDWDDAVLTQEELEEVLLIHMGHRNDGRIKPRETERTSTLQPTDGSVH